MKKISIFLNKDELKIEITYKDIEYLNNVDKNNTTQQEMFNISYKTKKIDLPKNSNINAVDVKYISGNLIIKIHKLIENNF